LLGLACGHDQWRGLMPSGDATSSAGQIITRRHRTDYEPHERAGAAGALGAMSRVPSGTRPGGSVRDGV
jgi:hypothetical protein